MRFDYNRLNLYCRENNVTLNNDYTTINLNGNKMIECKCLDCKCDTEIKFNLLVKTGCFCRKCKNKKKLEKRIRTNMERIGVPHPAQSKEVRDKMKATTLKKFGVENASQSKEIQERKTQTCMQNFGVLYPAQSKEVLDRMKATTLKKFGVENASQSKEIQDKKKDTCIEHFGVSCHLQSEEIKNRIKATNKDKYGFKSAMQNAEVFERNKSSSYKKKEYVFPSGRTNFVQGYEPQALDILIKQHQEDDIVTDNVEIETLCGSIWYTFENKKHRYYPDIYIKSSNTIIEIKSTYTFEVKKEINLKKRQACIEAGINFEFWLMNENGEILSKF